MSNINLANIKFSLEQIANDTKVIVTGVRTVKQYDENEKVTDKVIGYSYDVIAPQAKYASFAIKVEGKKPIITSEELESGGEVIATPVGFIGKFYRTRTGDYAFTSKADSLEIVR